MEQEASSLNLDWRKRVVIRAELAPGQMNRFDCKLERVPARPRPAQPDGDTFHFDNGTIRVAIDRRTGLIDAYQVDGKDTLKPGAARWLVMGDNPDPWAMTVSRFRRPRGEFRLLSPRKSAWLAGLGSGELAPVHVIEDGAVRTVVEALFGYRNNSYLCVRYKLPKQGSEIEIEARVHWNEKDRMLKLALPFIDPAAGLLGQVAYGAEELATNGNEAVAQKWALLSSGSAVALSVINDRTYGLDYKAGELRLTLLRSPGYAVHPILDRPLLPADRYSPRQDQGERIFHFWLQGGTPAGRLAAIDREALAHNEKPFALSFFPGGGQPEQAAAPLARLSDASVQITAIKKAEDSQALILRLFEPTGQPRSTTLELPFAGASSEVSLGAFEIRTLRFDLSTRQFSEVNLIEE